MTKKNLHIADEKLLLHGSGELPAKIEDQITGHLEQCMECSDRLRNLQATLTEVSSAHQQHWRTKLPEIEPSRAALRTSLSQLAAAKQHEERGTWTQIFLPRHAAALAGIAVIVLMLFTWQVYRPGNRTQPAIASLTLDEPDFRLTPGATIPVTANEVCGANAAKFVPSISLKLQRKVFELYGVTSPQPSAYEVDYLITPELGGATDIRNLWPEPYHNTMWNAYVKNQLEDRLHEMVCHGDVDLATAQRDISTDWIAAYRKYFHTNLPLSESSSENSLTPNKPQSPPSIPHA